MASTQSTKTVVDTDKTSQTKHHRDSRRKISRNKSIENEKEEENDDKNDGRAVLVPNKKDISYAYDKELYFIYHDDELFGPVDSKQILQLYRTKRIKKNKLIFVISAKAIHMNDRKDAWHRWEHIENPIDDRDANKKPSKDDNVEELGKYLKREVAIYFPVDSPSDIPEEKKSGWKRSVGWLLLICCAIVIIFHLFLTTIVALILFGCPLLIYYMKDENMDEEKKEKAFHVVYYPGVIVSLSGFVVVPAVMINYLFLPKHFHEKWIPWTEHQSWMMAYYIWSGFTYILSLIYYIALVQKKNWWRNRTSQMYDIILFIVGLKFENIDLSHILNNGWRHHIGTSLVMSLLFPALASLLPSAVGGFIANFFLEEQFILNCDYTDDYRHNQQWNITTVNSGSKIIPQWVGACQVYSSHDWRTGSYEFIGGLAANILFYWGLIKLATYFIVNAFGTLRVYARRIK
eukprot:295965_1